MGRPRDGGRSRRGSVRGTCRERGGTLLIKAEQWRRKEAEFRLAGKGPEESGEFWFALISFGRTGGGRVRGRSGTFRRWGNVQFFSQRLTLAPCLPTRVSVYLGIYYLLVHFSLPGIC